METSIASSAFCVLAWFPSPTSIAPSLSANYTITLPILSLTLRHYILISFVSQFRCQLYDTLMCHNTLDASNLHLNRREIARYNSPEGCIPKPYSKVEDPRFVSLETKAQ